MRRLTPLLVLAAACATAPSREQVIDQYRAELRKTYPPDVYYYAIGEGTTRQDAIADALDSVVNTFAGELESTFQQVYLQQAKGREIQEKIEVRNELKLKVRNQATILFPTPLELTRKRGDLWLAVALARRAELDDGLQREAARVTSELRAAWAAFASRVTWIEAREAWCDVKAKGHELELLDVQRLVTSRRTFWTPELRKAQEEAIAWKARAKAEFRVAVEKAPPATVDPTPVVLEALKQSGSAMGSIAVVGATASACAGNPDVLVVRPTVKSRCRVNQFSGYTICGATLAIQGVACRTDGVLFSFVTPEARSSDSQTGPQGEAAASARAEGAISYDEVLERAKASVVAAAGDRCD